MTARLVSPLELSDRVMRLYREGLRRGASTGWPSLDRFYTVAEGQITIVTGWPSSGKSEWLDALMMNLAQQGWTFAVFSPENKPEETHVAKLLEKRIGKPFGDGPSERMSGEEVGGGMLEVTKRFRLITSDTDQSLTVGEIMEAAEPWLTAAVSKRGLVIDPWNELEHWRPAALTETEYISRTLSHVRSWARNHGVHVWIMGHPRNVRREDGKLPVPRPDMISGSQHWWNKADCAVTIWRDMENPDSQNVEVHVQKVRFKHIGRPGVADLIWDRVSGRYHEPPLYSIEGGKKRA